MGWPKWACDEDGEYVWIRADIARSGDAAQVSEVAQIVAGGGHGYHLVHEYDVACSLDLAPKDRYAEWLIHEIHDADPGDDVVLYARYIITDVVEADDDVFNLAAGQ